MTAMRNPIVIKDPAGTLTKKLRDLHERKRERMEKLRNVEVSQTVYLKV